MPILNLLLVEDSDDDAELLLRHVRKSGYGIGNFRRVHSADTFFAALDDPSWDLIVCDFQMPGFTGMEALEILRKTDHDIPFLLVSGTVGEHVAVEAMRAGAQDYLLKDNLVRLIPAIERELREAALRHEKRETEANRSRLEQALQTVIKGTATTIGTRYFPSLVQTLAQALDVQAVFVARTREGTSSLQVVSWCGACEQREGQEIVLDPALRDELLASPFLTVSNPPLPRSLGFPAPSPAMLLSSRIESSDSRPLGVLALLAADSGLDAPLTRDLLSIFAARAGSELERLDAQHQREELERQLFHNQKLEAVGTLAGGIAHDFNNLLTAIWGNAQLIEMRLNQRRPIEPSHLSGILKACRRARELVRQILTYSRKSEPVSTALQLESVVEEVYQLLRSTLPSSIRMRCDFESLLPAIQGDPAQIHQIVMNLCTNAWQAMSEQDSGTLCVSVRRSSVRSPDGKECPTVVLEVEDSGPGIAPEILPRIFEPFYTTKGAGKGTGLGLSVVHGIVESHCAKIAVSSRPGSTLFSVTFPALSESSLLERSEHEAPEFSPGHHRILVIDDEPSVGEVLCQLLDMLHYESDFLQIPSEALDRVRAEPGTWSAVITDLTMPEMNGLELARQMREICPELPIVLTSGYEGAVDPRHLQEKRISALLSKPFEIEELGAVLRNILSGA